MSRQYPEINLDRRIVSFIGPEGSGKTTIAKRLSQASGKPYLATGATLRELAQNDFGPLGDQCRTMFAAHTYLDGPTLLEIMSKRFAREDTVDGFILDGGLRTVPETRDFNKVLAEAHRQLLLTVVYLQLPREVCLQRLVTGPTARKRSDDTVGAIDSRLASFHHRLSERLAIIKDQPDWSLVEIDARPPIETVYGQVCRALGSVSGHVGVA